LLSSLRRAHRTGREPKGCRTGLDVKTSAGQGSFYRSQHELIFVFKSADAPHCNNVELGRNGRNRSNVWNCPGVNAFRAGRPSSWNGWFSIRSERFYRDQGRIGTLLRNAKIADQDAVSALKRASKLGQELKRTSAGVDRSLLLTFVNKIAVHVDRLAIELSRAGLLEALTGGNAVTACAKRVGRIIALTTPCRVRRRGGEIRLVIGNEAGGEGRADPTLIGALVRAHAWWQELCAGNASSIKHIADREHSDERYVARVLKLAFLAPDITEAILDGRQPPHVTADALIKMPDLPPFWKHQRQRLEFST
jgi:hypothetical protein